MPNKISVFGLGNVLQEDDAFGPYTIRVLDARYRFPSEVTVTDLGTPGLDLIPYLAGQDAIIIVDTVRSKGDPGELRLYRRDDILRHPPQARVGPHDPGLKEALLSLEFAGRCPEDILLVGVIPDRTGYGVGLSKGVSGALAAVEAEVVRELERLGSSPERRDPPGEPDLWWERPAGERELVTRESWRKIERWLVVLIALHSYAVGLVLMLATRWGAEFGGWGHVEPLFFVRQAGVFHIVVATAYLVEYIRYGGVVLLVTAKATAVVFLTTVAIVDGGPWVVPLSAAADGLMGLVVVWVHRNTRV